MSRDNIPDISAMLNPRDRHILDDSPSVSWVPKNPRDLISIYIEPDDNEDRTSIDSRRKKSKEVYDGYGKIIEQCQVIEKEINAQSKDVVVELKPSNNLRAIDAVKRVFGTDGTKITFGMYKACIAALAESSATNIPNPGV